MAAKGAYRKLPKKICCGCDHPAYDPCPKINAKNACRKCRKGATSSKPREKWRYKEEADADKKGSSDWQTERLL